MPAEADRDLTGRLGPVEIDWPRSAGYYGGVGLAVALEIIDWPVGLFLASIPLVKLLNRAALPTAVRFTVHVFDGMAKPVGGDAEGTMRLVRTPRKLKRVTQRAVGARPAGRKRSAQPATGS
jgi:hypothetical protein